MFRSFFLNRQWQAWSILGSLIILFITWYKVQLDVEINEWFGEFYNMIQDALSKPNQITEIELLSSVWDFVKISLIYIFLAVILEFFIRHYVFRWRTAMYEYYVSNWSSISHIEGASQRVQEDTMRFSKIMEGLGVSLLRSIMTLVAFLPVLWELSIQVKKVPFLGEVDHVLIYVAILSATFGTVLLALVGIKLPGLEFKNQKAEAALRKELVLGEDDVTKAGPMTLTELYTHVRTNYLTLYKHYLYFDLAKWSYMQASSIFPYVVMAPTIVSGVITLGVLQQILRAFGRVESSLQYLVYSWSSIVELVSVYQRLKSFEVEIGKQVRANETHIEARSEG
jgi:peptide/bleomycin uptake transporter